MKSIFTDAQRKQMETILNEMWEFVEYLNVDQIKKYSNHYPKEVAKLAEEMGAEKFFSVLRDSELGGHYNPKHSFFVVDPFGNRFYSYNDVYELFAILRRFY